MSENWQAGDLAECVDVSDIKRDIYRPLDVARGGRYLLKGMIYVVREVISEDRGLLLDVGADYGPKLAQRFKKVPPLEDEEPASRAAPRELEAA